jgi:hypothetical protein
MGKFARALDGAVLGFGSHTRRLFCIFISPDRKRRRGGAACRAPRRSRGLGLRRRAGKKGRPQRTRAPRPCDGGRPWRFCRSRKRAIWPGSTRVIRASSSSATQGQAAGRRRRARPSGAAAAARCWRLRPPAELRTALWAAVEGLRRARIALTDTARWQGDLRKVPFASGGRPAPAAGSACAVPRKRAKHCALYGCAMLGVYLMTGLYTYLAASLTLLALDDACASAPSRPPGFTG